MKRIVLYFLNFNERNIFGSKFIFRNKFIVKESSLLYRNDFVFYAVHHKNFTTYICNVINIGKMIFFEFDILGILIIEHAT